MRDMFFVSLGPLYFPVQTLRWLTAVSNMSDTMKRTEWFDWCSLHFKNDICRYCSCSSLWSGFAHGPLKNDWLTRFDQKLERHPGSLAFAMEQRVSTKSLNWFSEQSIFSHIHCRRLFDQFQSEAASRTYRKTQFFTAMEPQPLIAMSCGEQGAAPEAEVVPKDGKEGSKEGCNCCGAKEAGLWVDVSPFHPFCEGWSILEMMGMNG